jgi:hypothetical protein
MFFSSLPRVARRVLTAGALVLGLSVAAHSASAAGTIVLHAEAAQTAAGTQYTQLTATGNFTGGGYPGSSFYFQVDGGQIIPAGCSAWGTTGICQVNYPTASLAAGSHVITVTYPGDTGYTTATSTAPLFVTSSSIHYIGINVAYVNTTYGVSTITASASVYVPSGVLPQNLYSISFSIDGGTSVAATCSLTSGNQATCSANLPVTGLLEGYHSILFNVPPDTYYTTAQQGGNTLLLK